jgi:large subunit ribosomal protein L6
VKGPKGTLSHRVATPIAVGRGDNGELLGHAAGRRAQLARAARPHPHADREHGRRRDAGLREEARDRRHRLPRAGARARDLEFALGYSHPITVRTRRTASRSRSTAPTGSRSGIDKQQVGEVAANLRKLRKPDPYKGKGVRYAGEQIKRKVGKAGKK